ncbi:MAG: 3-dehydroquinate synthase [Bacteroidota bacterium]
MNLEKIVITEDVNAQLQQTLSEVNFTQVAVLVDENTLTHCYPIIENVLPSHSLIQINSGEEFKTIKTCSTIWKKLTSHAFDRKGLLINLGGGVIGDMGGFCARTYKRGLQFINLPTTLLAQVDASIGGKLGIDFEGLKNHIGLFSEPDQVIVDPVFLNSLPKEELTSGFAEVIKHNLIADVANWNRLNKLQLNDINWVNTIRHSIEIKKRVVEEDPFESGKRKILNFGHTIGHAVESYRMLMGKRILHGEAVALGMIAETQLSYQKKMITEYEKDAIEEYIDSKFNRIDIKADEIEKVVSYAVQDKKNEGNTILAALLDGIGSARWDIQLTSEEAKASLRYYANYT